VTSSDLSLVSLTFTIQSVAASGSVTAREFDSAVVAEVKDMVDTNTETFVTDSPVKVHDARSGIGVSGQLTVWPIETCLQSSTYLRTSVNQSFARAVPCWPSHSPNLDPRHLGSMPSNDVKASQW